MNDRALLEAAAKAAGLSEHGWMGGTYAHVVNNTWATFDPLNDDGDALRLAVKLRLCLFLEIPRIGIGPMHDGPEVYIEDGEDEMAATRRAIVRAAAAVWEQRQKDKP